MPDKQWMKESFRNSRQRSGAAGNASRGSPVTWILAGVTALAIIGIALFAIIQTAGGGESSFTPNDQGLLPAGSAAPDFTAESLNDRGEVSLSNTGGGSADTGATLLVFFATWCPYCNNEAPVIADVKDGYGEDLQVLMIGIDEVQGDTPADVRGFVEEYGIDAPALYEPSLGQEYQVSGYPTQYVLDQSGEVVAANSGEVSEDALRGWIDEALA